jgi:hypothetical protein
MIGPPHSKLMVSILKAFGLPQNGIGESSLRIPGNGTVVDLTGSLDRLS